MVSGNVFKERQLWAVPSRTSSSIARHCTPFTLPSHGLLTIDYTSIITLTQNAIFQPECTGEAAWEQGPPSDPTSIADLRDPFYASTLPQIFAIAAATVVSYMLVIMLFITPRTFFVAGPGGGSGFLGRQGMISGASGSTSVVGVGRRPWLQKVAALTVAISLTIATVDTFRVAGRQYDVGYMDASALTQEVVGGLEIRIVRVISDTFLWLAQVQTLIRLFPRHKEKVIIKWTGFALIVLDTTFSILNSFVANTDKSRPRKFIDAIPALNYLFALALSLLYAAWVVYYSLSKRRFAFFHPKMRNICLVAILALAAVLIPVVFFVLDISNPSVAGWGDYVRWVGAAAASVVVWEWVERIEALERDERKDGILGREIFELDEMLEVTPSDEVNWPRRINRGNDGDGRDGGGVTTGWNGTTARANCINRTSTSANILQTNSKDQNPATIPTISKPVPSAYAPPPNIPNSPTPVSRDNTTSAASTEYAIHYHTVNQPTPPILENTPEQMGCQTWVDTFNAGQLDLEDSRRRDQQTAPETNLTRVGNGRTRWQAARNPFKRRRASPPPEVADAPVAALSLPSSDTESDLPQNLKKKALSFATGHRDRLRTRARRREAEVPLSVTVIPAQPRGRQWLAAIPQATEGGDMNQERHASELVPRIDHSKAKGKAVERESWRVSHDEPSSSQPRHQRYSPTNLDNQLLSQRGALIISEDRSRHTPAHLLSVTSPSSSPGQSSNGEGTSGEADPSQTQLATSDPNSHTAMNPMLAGISEQTIPPQAFDIAGPQLYRQEPSVRGFKPPSPLATSTETSMQERAHDATRDLEP